MDLHYKIDGDNDHVVKFRGNRSTDIGDPVCGELKQEAKLSLG